MPLKILPPKRFPGRSGNRYMMVAALFLFLSAWPVKAQVSSIKVLADPGTEVYLDGRSMGTIPGKGILDLMDLRIGYYKLKLVSDTGAMEETIVIPDKNERIVFFDLKSRSFEDRSPVHRSSKEKLLNYNWNRGTSGSFTDRRDGKRYRTIQIGNTIWMAENLNYNIPGHSFVYPRDPVHEKVYGRLYPWVAALHACPEGWQLPTDSEWHELELQVGMADTLFLARGWRKCKQNASLKSEAGWLASTPAKDTIGFSAIPGGFRDADGFFYNEGYFAYFWTATEADTTNAWYRVLTSDLTDIGRFSYSKEYAFSIRCVRKEEQSQASK